MPCLAEHCLRGGIEGTLKAASLRSGPRFFGFRAVQESVLLEDLIAAGLVLTGPVDLPLLLLSCDWRKEAADTCHYNYWCADVGEGPVANCS